MADASNDLTMRAREEDYEVALPAHWTKRELPDGTWILHSTKGPESLRVRVLEPADGGAVDDPERGAKAAAEGLTSAMAEHHLVKSGWDGKTFSITGTGSSQQKASLAFRVLADQRKIVWALHEVSAASPSSSNGHGTTAADPALDERRLAILASLSLR